jgi:hypothetical protein
VWLKPKAQKLQYHKKKGGVEGSVENWVQPDSFLALWAIGIGHSLAILGKILSKDFVGSFIKMLSAIYVKTVMMLVSKTLWGKKNHTTGQQRELNAGFCWVPLKVWVP